MVLVGESAIGRERLKGDLLCRIGVVRTGMFNVGYLSGLRYLPAVTATNSQVAIQGKILPFDFMYPYSQQSLVLQREAVKQQVSFSV